MLPHLSAAPLALIVLTQVACSGSPPTALPARATARAPSAGTKLGQVVVLGSSDVWILGITGGWRDTGVEGPPEPFVVSRSQPVSAVLRL